MTKRMISIAAGLCSVVTALAVVAPVGARVPSQQGSSTSDSHQGPGSGRQLFMRNCARCHGADAKGKKGPALAGRTLNQEEIEEMVTAGQPSKMPTFGRHLSAAEISAVAAYVRSLGRGS